MISPFLAQALSDFVVQDETSAVIPGTLTVDEIMGLQWCARGGDTRGIQRYATVVLAARGVDPFVGPMLNPFCSIRQEA